jgi:hypothetical protein
MPTLIRGRPWLVERDLPAYVQHALVLSHMHWPFSQRVKVEWVLRHRLTQAPKPG